MKKYVSILIIVLMTFTSCNEDLLIYDSTNGQTLVQFDQSNGSLPTPDQGAFYEVDVLVTTKSNADRAITLEVDGSSTATSDQYEITNLVIPANSFVGTIRISSYFNALPEEGSAYIVLNIIDIANSNTIIENGQFSLELFRKCPIVLADFVGTWSGDGAWSIDFGYPTEVVTYLNADGDLMMNGMVFGWFTGWWDEVIVTNEAVKLDVDLETGEFIIAEQFYITSTWVGDPQPPYNVTGEGIILNACQKTMTVYPVLVQNGGNIDGTAWGVQFEENISLDN